MHLNMVQYYSDSNILLKLPLHYFLNLTIYKDKIFYQNKNKLRNLLCMKHYSHIKTGATENNCQQIWS